ncbi:hypothetical protein ACLOJK_024247 [Asimina triloba]
MAVDAGGFRLSYDRRAVQQMASGGGGRRWGQAHFANEMGGLDHPIQAPASDDSEVDGVGKIDSWLRFGGEGDEGVVDYQGGDDLVIDGRDMPEENGLIGGMILRGSDLPIGPRHAASLTAAMATALVGDGGAPYPVLHGCNDI